MYRHINYARNSHLATDGDISDLRKRLRRAKKAFATELPEKLGSIVVEECETTKAELAKHGTGELAESLTIRKRHTKAGKLFIYFDSTMMVSDYSGKTYNLAKLVDLGTRAHIEVSRHYAETGESGVAPMVFYWKKKGVVVRTDWVYHPGSRPLGFYERTLARIKGKYKYGPIRRNSLMEIMRKTK